MVALQTEDVLLDELARLASALDDWKPADGRELPDADLVRRRIVRTIRAYLIPQMRHPDRPLVVVFAGPTGSGKSTLVNSLSGLEVSETGPIRPTTRIPLVLAAEGHRHRFEEISGIGCEVVGGSSPALDSLALVDTPDIDSTETEHRATAEHLIDSSDVVVYVISASRYADLVPWEVLRRAQSRGAPVLLVLNRVTRLTSGALTDFAGKLRKAGLDGDILPVPEHRLRPGSSAVPSLAVRGLQRKLLALATEREVSRRKIFHSVMSSMIEDLDHLAEEVDASNEKADRGEQNLREAFRRANELDARLAALDDLDLGQPPVGGWWRTRRWMRASRLSSSDSSRYETRTRHRIVSSVESDLRRRALRADISDLSAGEVLGVIDSLQPLVDDAARGWLLRVSQETTGIGERLESTARAALISAAVAGRNQGAVAFFFGSQADEVVLEMRDRLAVRLEVVYGQAAESLLDRSRSRRVDLTAPQLRDRVAMVVAHSHFAHA